MRQNLSEQDVIDNVQSNYSSVSYYLDNISAYSDIGFERKTQEDSLIIASHPDNNSIKLLALADGMGGLKNGAVASNIAICEIYKWFKQSLLIICESEIMSNLEAKIYDIDNMIRYECGNGGTTLSISIIFEKNTYFFNIGDSRIYIHHDDALDQITNDNTISWLKYKQNIITSKEHIKFHKQNNLLCSKLGCLKRQLILDKKILDNNMYNSILMFTDGVTDFVDDFEIYNILCNSNGHDIAKAMVDKALNTVAIKDASLSNDYYDKINGGRDNATAIVYKKKVIL